jgi:hypothetical protein
MCDHAAVGGQSCWDACQPTSLLAQGLSAAGSCLGWTGTTPTGALGMSVHRVFPDITVHHAFLLTVWRIESCVNTAITAT